MNSMKAGAVFFSAWVILATVLAGQAVSGRIIGTVRDEENRKLAGVRVTAVNAAKNSRQETHSDGEDGAFRLLGLGPGYYQLEFEMSGYEPYTLGGIALSVEQSVTLHVTLKKTASDPGTGGADPAADVPEPDDRKIRTDFFAERERWAIHFSFSANCLAGGDSNAFLRGFSRRVFWPLDTFETLHSGSDLSIEVGCRATPRLEIALGWGLVRSQKKNNDLISRTQGKSYGREVYVINLKAQTLPVQLICRYWLAGRASRIYSVYGAILFQFASWSMGTYYYPTMYQGSPAESIELESARRQGLGLAAGGRIEWKLDENLSFSVDLSGRYAPLRGFSGKREYYPHGKYGVPQVSRGKLWFFEYFDQATGQWLKDLGIGDRPSGTGIRNVASARVDFSGLALRLGFLFRI